MAEVLTINKGASKQEVYEEILPQIKSLIADETDLIANLSNISAVLMQAFSPLWVGFYLRKDRFLVLGPFQGPLACTRIPVEPIARGVCGAAAKEMRTLVVPDVDKFEGHIACSSDSKSEVVIPLVVEGVTQLVLDIDSPYVGTYDETDAHYLGKVIELVRERHFVAA